MNETKPLKGIKILDFTRLLPGPFGTHFLSQMGATVTKVESPKRMDYTRFEAPKIGKDAALFHTLNTSKEFLLVDYQSEEGYAQIVEEIKKTDVIVEQFRPGAMKSFKLDFDTVKAINPNIVYISVTGFGQTGAYSHKAGHDLNFIATAGLLDMNRDANGKPIIPGFQIGDIAGSYLLMNACTTGLLAQRLQNKPQFVDVSLTDAALPFNAIPFGMLQGGVNYHDAPTLSGAYINYDVYKCIDDKWIALGAFELKFWNRFCEIVDKEHWKTDSHKTLHRDVFNKQEIIDLFKSQPRDYWIHLTKDEDICISPVLELSEVSKDQHIKDRELIGQTEVSGKQFEFYQSPLKVYS